MNRGTLFGVSVGPGDPDLMTIKALKAINQCPAIAAPRSAGKTTALDIARKSCDLDSKEILLLDFAMAKDEKECSSLHSEAAQQIRGVLDRGDDVAMLSLGDISIYASFNYIAERLCDDYQFQMIPGVTSFCAAAASAKISLTNRNEPIYIFPGALTDYDKSNGTQIYMKSGSKMGALLDELEAQGKLASSIMVQSVGMEKEKIFRGAEMKDAPQNYFSLVIVRE